MNKSESKYFNTAIRFDKALLDLIEKKPFEYITIREICEKAQINRSTFYLHYENTNDLLNETVSYILEKFTSYFNFDNDSVSEKFANTDLQDLQFVNEKYMRPYLNFAKENQRVFSAVLSHPITFDASAIFNRRFEYIFKPILDRFAYPPDDQHYVMMFYLNGITAIIAEWIKDDCRKSIEEIMDIIYICIYGKDTEKLNNKN